MFRKKITGRMRSLGNNKKKNNISRKGGKSIQNYTPLIEAIQERDVNQVRRLLDSDNDPNEKDNIEGWSPMKWAHFVYLHGEDRDSEDNQRACLAIINLLIEKGVDIQRDYDDNESNTYIFPSAPPIEESENSNILSGGGRRRRTRKKCKYTMKGGRSLTEADRINYALSGNYTSLINAIISEDINEIIRVLQTGADANQRDTVYNWCPMKWVAFVYYYGNNHNPNMYREIKRSLTNANPPGRDCFDEYHIDADSYNFSPVILDIDEQLERIRSENEHLDDDNIPNRRTAGGKRRRKTRKSKKSHIKTKRRSSTKRRKHMKK
jgi:hypothetical protein